MRPIPVLAALLAIPSVAAFPIPVEEPPLALAAEWLRLRSRDDGCVGPDPTGPCTHGSTRDAVIAVSAAGHDPRAWHAGGESPIAYLRAHRADLEAETGGCPACLWAKTIVALASSTEDPRVFDGFDYVERLDRYFDGVQVGSPSQVNDDAWALFAYAATDEPDASKVDAIRLHLAARQNAVDGGWSWNLAPQSDAWGTATVLLALLATGTPPEAPATQGALDFLRAAQGGDGLIDQDGSPSAESTALAAQAARAAGEDPTRWSAGGPNLVDALLALQGPDGSFAHNAAGGSRFLATTQVLPALRGLPYPFRPPVVEVRAEPMAASAGTPITWTCLASDPDGSVVRTEWLWPDSTRSPGPSATRAFTDSGPVTARCEVEDDAGAVRTGSRTVEILPPAPAPPAPAVDGAASADDETGAARALERPAGPTPAPSALLVLLILGVLGVRRR